MTEPKGSKHFGLPLLKCLAEQLSAVLVFSPSLRATGTVVTLTIPNAEQRASHSGNFAVCATAEAKTSEVIS